MFSKDKSVKKLPLENLGDVLECGASHKVITYQDPIIIQQLIDIVIENEVDIQAEDVETASPTKVPLYRIVYPVYREQVNETFWWCHVNFYYNRNEIQRCEEEDECLRMASEVFQRNGLSYDLPAEDYNWGKYTNDISNILFAEVEINTEYDPYEQ